MRKRKKIFQCNKKYKKIHNSYHSDHTNGNCIIRHHIETRTQDTYHHKITAQLIKKEISDLNKLEESSQYSSLFSYDHIKAKPYHWQSDLDRISDFLTGYKGFWWY